MYREPYKIVPADSTQYVSLSDAKAHCRITDDDTSQDNEINRFIETAGDYITLLVRRPMFTTQFGLKLDGFYNHSDHSRVFGNLSQSYGLMGYGYPNYSDPIYLPLAPLQSVDSISYIKQDGTSQTLDPASYVVDTFNLAPKIYPNYGCVFPVPQPIQNCVTITFTAGYMAIPAGIQSGILLLVSHWFFNRESVAMGVISQKVAQSLDAVLSPYNWGAGGCV